MALPYLTPNLDDARLYSLASDIKASSNTTHDIDDIYNILVNIRTYVSNDVDILARLNDLTGYNTAYNTHSMIMDVWKRIGGNSTLGDSYTIIDLLNDIHDTFSNNIIDNGLSVSNGAETYYISEILAGIYGQFSTPRSIPDLYNKLSDIQNDLNDNFISIANDTFSINSAIQRLADIYASNDVAQAKLNQQDYEDGAIADFTGNGAGAATIANKNDIKGISSTVKQGLNTGGSASNALGVFSYNGSEWDWFTVTTRNNLDRTGDNPFYTNTFVDTQFNTYGNGQYIKSLPTRIPANTTINIVTGPTQNIPGLYSAVYLVYSDSSIESVGIIRDGNYTLNTTFTPSKEVVSIQYQYLIKNYTYNLYIAEQRQTRNTKYNINYIPDFITNHDLIYYNSLSNEVK